MPAAERGRREVRGTDIRGREARVAMKEPRFRVQSCSARVVRDLHLGARQSSQRVDRLDLGGAGERRREDSQARFLIAIARRQILERIPQRAHTAGRDERDERVHAIGALDLARQLGGERRLAAPSREERRCPERRRRPRGAVSGVDRDQPLSRRRQLLIEERRCIELRAVDEGQHTLQESIREREGGGVPLIRLDGPDHAGELRRQMTRNDARDLVRTDRFELRSHRRRDLLERSRQRDGYRVIVEPRRELLRHVAMIARRRGGAHRPRPVDLAASGLVGCR
ncbi:MAG TPA: hypothetical protein VL463_34085 [Kofleriaceae bacterium]|nr:hypothetical protein [Kofleriaceae bacterium]